MIRFERLLIRTLEFLLATCLLAITATVVTLVVLRYLMNSSITGANELTTVLFTYATSIGSAIVIGRQEHIAISFAVDPLPPRLQNITDKIGLIFVAFLNLILLSESLGWIHITGDYLMPATGLPRRFAQFSVPMGCGLAILFCVLRLLSPRNSARNLAGADE